VLTQYFYEQLLQFEKDPAGLKDTIGEMVYGMDVDHEVHRARQIEFDREGDEDVLQHSKPRPLTGLDLAEAKLASGDVAAASATAQKVLAEQTDTIQSTAGSRPFHHGPRGFADWPS
jgi:Tfp pilus assembly protein FimV